MGCWVWWASREGQRRGPWQRCLLWGAASRRPAACPEDGSCLRLCPLPAAAAPEHRPRGSVPTGLTATYLRMYFPKLGCKSPSLLFQHMQVCSLLVKLVQRTEPAFTAVAGEICSPAACRRSSLQPPEETDGVCKPERASVLLSLCARSALPVCVRTAVPLEDELKS